MSLKSIDVSEYGNYSVLLLKKFKFRWSVNLQNSSPSVYSHTDLAYVRSWTSPVFSGAKYNWVLGYDSGNGHSIHLSLNNGLASTVKKVYAEFSFAVSCNGRKEQAVPGGVMWFCNNCLTTSKFSFRVIESLQSLVISVAINVQLDRPSSSLVDLQPRPVVPVVPSSTKYIQDMLSVFNSGNFSDILILVGSKEFKCHKSILAGRSSYFEAMLNARLSESTENIVQITDFTADTIEDMVTYLYTSIFKTSPLTVDSAMELLRAGDKYQVLDMKDECEKFLKKAITGSNALDILLCADLCSAKKLKKSAIDFICKNRRSFTAASQYESLLARPHLLRDLLVSACSST